MKTKLKSVIIITLALGGSLGGVYFLFKKFMHDRESAIHFEKNQTYQQQKTLPPGVKPLPQPVTNNSADSVQRTLQTVNEINRINEMNRRIIEQQQKMQNQK